METRGCAATNYFLTINLINQAVGGLAVYLIFWPLREAWHLLRGKAQATPVAAAQANR